MHALRLQLGGVAVDRGGLVEEAHAGDARGGDDAGRLLQDRADEADGDAAHARDGVGREQWLARSLVDDVGSEVLELGAAEAAGGGVEQARVGAGHEEATALGGGAAAVLQAAQLGHALVELVVADGRVAQAHQAERFDSRLVAQQARDEGTGADEVARADAQAGGAGRRGLGLAGVEIGSHDGGAAKGPPVARARHGFELAVEVVDREELDLDRARLSAARRRQGAEPERARDEERGDGPPRRARWLPRSGRGARRRSSDHGPSRSRAGKPREHLRGAL